MADDKKSQADNSAFAERIYETMVGMSGGVATEQMALKAIRAASIFEAAKAKVASGAFEVNPQADWGADCEAPNMSPMHPVNLLSSARNTEKKGANRELVNRIAKLLETNQDPEYAYKDPSGHWAWSKDETKTARRLFPEFADTKN